MSANDLVAATPVIPVQVVTQVDMGELTTLWEMLKAGLSSDTGNILTLHQEHYNALDDGAKAFLACMLMSEIHEPVLYARDGNGANYVYLGTPRALTAGPGMLVNPTGAGEALWMVRPEGAPVKIPRPPNAYILYRKERHHLVKSMKPNITNNEISQILGRCWNMESRAIRAEYKVRADEVKRLHYEKHPDYQYRPRRPSERRRRANPSAATALGRAVQANQAASQAPIQAVQAPIQAVQAAPQAVQAAPQALGGQTSQTQQNNV
ncbi:hypothetical protein CDV31_016119 [Fusarium ambrosium]|uniref:HMG box domain-containing protein n=1 Tax=Fusarium ambrosium TaxID=131363 RepID=A0A428SEJ8_9HYPO|nr:hypothetical protein CDV31_016119 [Fusarium ambrosium]